MSTSLLYHTQKIRDFQHVSHSYDGRSLTWHIVRNPAKFKCCACDSVDVIAHRVGDREVVGVRMGTLSTVLVVGVHRLKCNDCEAYRMERLNFLPSQKSRFTKAVANEAIYFRNHMSIKAVSEYLGLHWNTVRDIEKNYLSKKYARISLRDVTSIGIDEVYMGSKGYLTIVRDLTLGTVLFIGDGKNKDCLAPFTRRLRHSSCKISSVAIDLGSSYAAWAKETIPSATIVYDRFHVIKLMNDKLNVVRRKTMKELEGEEKELLTGKRFLLMRNQEDLSAQTKKDLDAIRRTYHDLSEMSLMKECLRNVYSIAKNEREATIALQWWCKLAKKTAIAELKTMAKTITSRFDGIIAFWKNRISSASMEGFNNKIGWLTRQAYGYRDMDYLKLKIFDLPTMKTTKSL